MKKYQYQILRYVHDQFTQEFVNLGVVVYSAEENFLKATFSNKYSRINALFPNANGRFVSQITKRIQVAINKVSVESLNNVNKYNNISAITSSILPIDDSALQFTEPLMAIDFDLERAGQILFSELVEKYILNENSIKTLSDDDVWKKKYKTYFDEYKISEKLKEHKVATQNDVFLFDKSWKNEVWHCYQPLSFDLQTPESIKEKVYRWSGKLKEIQKVNQSLHLTFLSAVSESHFNLKDFVINSLSQEIENLKVEVIMEQDAEKLVQKIKRQMHAHDQMSF